jgi:phosphatidylglycerol:prolipoprotein diacylglycerol transferase
MRLTSELEVLVSLGQSLEVYWLYTSSLAGESWISLSGWMSSHLPWLWAPEYRLPGYENQATYHPIFLYESLWNFGIVALLLWLGRKYQDRLINGDLFLIYLITYPLGRFMLEFLRLDPARVGGININQTVMLLVALVSTGVLIWRHRKRAGTDAETVEV